LNLNKLKLTEEEMIQLYDIHQAYNRPHPPAMSWRECREAGLEPRDFARCGMVEIQESLDEIDVMSSFHLSEEGTVMSGEAPRASWVERRINRWSRS
jgi:hypothetical protein